MKRYGCRITLIFCLLILVTACAVRPGAMLQAEENQFRNHPAVLPERIVLNPGADPTRTMAISWRTREALKNPRARLALAKGEADFDEAARDLPVRVEKLALADGGAVYQYSAIFDKLQAGTLYAYQVGSPQGWSAWNQFRSAGPGPLTLVYFGDAQNEVEEKCSRVFRAARQKAPAADGWLIVGDLVDQGSRDQDWREFFSALGDSAREIPLLPLAGNHEYPDARFVRGPDFKLCRFWRPQFTLPENGPPELPQLRESVYFVDWPELRFVALNGNEKLAEQAHWLDKVLSRSPKTWTIVAIHQPLYATGKKDDKQKYLKIFGPVIDRHQVDLVLQGHVHNYSRSAGIRDGKRVEEQGTVYVISICGPKNYPITPRYRELMIKTGNGSQLFQVIKIDGRYLQFNSYDAAGILYDHFQLKK